MTDVTIGEETDNMQNVEFRNCRYNKHGTVDMEINHPQHGWIKFTACPDDVEPMCNALYQAAVEIGDIAPYVPPPPPTVEEIRAAMPPLSPMQFRTTLYRAGLLDNVIAAIDAMPEPQKGEAKIAFEYATKFQRNHGLIIQLAAAMQLSDVQIDDMWNVGLSL